MRTQNKHGWVYRAKSKDCRKCPLRNRCISQDASSRTVLISHGYEALLRARRRHRQPDQNFVAVYKRHRWRAEGMHGEAKTQHGLRKAVRRGLANVAIQAYLTAAVINLKRLVVYAGLLFAKICLHLQVNLVAERFDIGIVNFYGNRKRNFLKKKAG
jgi:IS5 family transposase